MAFDAHHSHAIYKPYIVGMHQRVNVIRYFIHSYDGCSGTHTLSVFC